MFCSERKQLDAPVTMGDSSTRMRGDEKERAQHIVAAVAADYLGHVEHLSVEWLVDLTDESLLI
jgi:hypothetical protein